MRKVDESLPVTSYLDDQDHERTFSTSTHVDIMNTTLCAINKKYGNQLFFSVCGIVTNSIDERTMKSVLNKEKVSDFANLRETYVESLLYHESNSDTMISHKMNKFTSQTDFKMNQYEPPIGYLKRLQDEANEINAMAPTGEPAPITDRMLRNKFLTMVQQVDYLKSAMISFDVGYVENGKLQEFTVQKYAELLQNVYTKRKDKASITSRDHGYSSSKGYLVQDEEEEVEVGMAAFQDKKDGSSPGLCFIFRDTGKCKFGDKCRYEHPKGKFQPKFPHKANFSQEAMLQYMENTELENERNRQEHALQIQELEKKFKRKFIKKKDKMKPYKAKLDAQNSKSSKARANLAEEQVPDEKVNAAKELEEVSDNQSDLSAMSSEEEDQ